MRKTNLLFSAFILGAFLLLSGCVFLEELRSSTDSRPSEPAMTQPVVAEKLLLQDPCVTEQIVQKIIEYQNYISNLSMNDFERELKEVAAYDLTELGSDEKVHIIMLSLASKGSSRDNIKLKRMLDSMHTDSQNESHELVGVLLEISRKSMAMRLQKDLLSDELGATLQKIIVLDQNIMAEKKKSETLQKQLQGLRDIEKIILKREKSDLPGQ